MSSSRERLRSAERAGFRSWITKTLDDRSRLLFGGPGGADKSGSLRAPEQHSIISALGYTTTTRSCGDPSGIDAELSSHGKKGPGVGYRSLRGDV